MKMVSKLLVFHEYCFTPRFIKRLLSDHGFTEIEVYNASLSGVSLIKMSSIFSLVARSIELMDKTADTISGRQVLLGSSLEIIATKSGEERASPSSQAD